MPLDGLKQELRKHIEANNVAHIDFNAKLDTHIEVSGELLKTVDAIDKAVNGLRIVGIAASWLWKVAAAICTLIAVGWLAANFIWGVGILPPPPYM